MFSFLSAMALGGLWFGGCNVRNSDPVSPNSAVQTQTPIISTETPTATATPTSTVTFIPTVVSNPQNGIVLDNGGFNIIGGTGGSGGSAFTAIGGNGGSALLTLAGAVSVDSSSLSVTGGVGGSGGYGGNAGSASATLTFISLTITPPIHHHTPVPTPTHFVDKPTHTPAY